MQGARMPMPDGFLAGTSRIDRIERQRDFDELAGDLMGKG